jgi:hypothetical protein
MYEINFLAVGEQSRSGNAITPRYILPGRETPAIVIVDSDFQDPGLEDRWFF